MPPEALEFLTHLPGGFIVQRERDGSYFVALMQDTKSYAWKSFDLNEAFTHCLNNVKRAGA